MEKTDDEICNNDKEWRKHILSLTRENTRDIKKINRRMDRLGLIVAGFGSFFGLLGSMVKAGIDRLNL